MPCAPVMRKVAETARSEQIDFAHLNSLSPFLVSFPACVEHFAKFRGVNVVGVSAGAAISAPPRLSPSCAGAKSRNIRSCRAA